MSRCLIVHDEIKLKSKSKSTYFLDKNITVRFCFSPCHPSIGEAILPLDARFVGGNRSVLLRLADTKKRKRGFARVEAFWVDEAKPRKETGDFYYKVL